MQYCVIFECILRYVLEYTDFFNVIVGSNRTFTEGMYFNISHKRQKQSSLKSNYEVLQGN